MNTKIHYLYRDGSNYKTRQMAILKGEYTEEDIKKIAESMDGEYFIPEQVGLSLNRGWDDITEDDHCWCELYPEFDFELTDEKPTDDRTISELAEDFESVEAWDDVEYFY